MEGDGGTSLVSTRPPPANFAGSTYLLRARLSRSAPSHTMTVRVPVHHLPPLLWWFPVAIGTAIGLILPIQQAACVHSPPPLNKVVLHLLTDFDMFTNPLRTAQPSPNPITPTYGCTTPRTVHTPHHHFPSKHARRHCHPQPCHSRLILRRYNTQRAKVFTRRQAVNDVALKGTNAERVAKQHDINLLSKIRYLDRQYLEAKRFCVFPQLLFLCKCKPPKDPDNPAVVPHYVCLKRNLIAQVSFVVLVVFPIFVMVPAYRVAGNLSTSFNDKEGQAVVSQVLMSISALWVVALLLKIAGYVMHGRHDAVRKAFSKEQKSMTMNALGFNSDGSKVISLEDKQEARANLDSEEGFNAYKENKVAHVKPLWM